MCLKLLRRGFAAADGMFTRTSDLSGFVVFRFFTRRYANHVAITGALRRTTSSRSTAQHYN